MDQTDEKQSPTEKKAPMDRRVKLVFLAIVLIGAAGIAYYQLRGQTLGEEWGDDLDAAFAEAKVAQPRKKIVVFVDTFPTSFNGQKMISGPLSKKKSREALEAFVLVKLRLKSDADWAKKYGVTKAPTMLVISADGEAFHKAEGYVGEIDFVKRFLVAELKSVGSTP